MTKRTVATTQLELQPHIHEAEITYTYSVSADGTNVTIHESNGCRTSVSISQIRRVLSDPKIIPQMQKKYQGALDAVRESS
jgi:archaellum component FlaF (FlaF/FlaG flagellin family)